MSFKDNPSFCITLDLLIHQVQKQGLNLIDEVTCIMLFVDSFSKVKIVS